MLPGEDNDAMHPALAQVSPLRASFVPSEDPRLPVTAADSRNRASRDSKAALFASTSRRVPRYIVHQDADSDHSDNDAPDVVELPPTYKPGRRSTVISSASGGDMHSTPHSAARSDGNFAQMQDEPPVPIPSADPHRTLQSSGIDSFQRGDDIHDQHLHPMAI